MQQLGRLLWFIISSAVIALAVNFTVSNDLVIVLSLWPFSQTLNIPTWLPVVVAFIIGGILGGGVIWGQSLAIRTKLWRCQLQINKLRSELSHHTEEGTRQTFRQTTEK